MLASFTLHIIHYDNYFGVSTIVSHSNGYIKMKNCLEFLLKTSLLIDLSFTSAHYTPGRKFVLFENNSVLMMNVVNDVLRKAVIRP